MKYKTGDFTLIKFDRFGSKKTTKTYKTYLIAKKKLDKYLIKNYNCSGVIQRVIHNSSITNDKWGWRENDM